MRAMVDLTTCLSNGSICWKVKGMIPSCQRNQGLSKWPPPFTDVPNNKRAGRSISLVQCPLCRVEWLQLQLQFKRGVLAVTDRPAHNQIPPSGLSESESPYNNTSDKLFGKVPRGNLEICLSFSPKSICCIPIEYVEKVT